ncbi:hypothetical protein FOA52_003451 [Chlamydomonas sp. UWO 241]|nr:hypothetical protein FOA52_003451 [Chlamydomonas sp. UWO 241]
MMAYGEFRKGYDNDTEDTRLVYYGMRYIIEEYVSQQWTMQDVVMADSFFKTHMAPGFTDFPFPRELFVKFVEENDGYFPVTIETLPEGTCIHVRVPVYQITAEGEYSPLVTFLETLLTMVWYPTTVATLSRRARDVVEASFEKTSEGGKCNLLVGSRLHDFGFRGCTSVEQSIIGGCAHLLNFRGTDTMSAAYYAQFHLNGGRPVGMSVPATEHSVMTAWGTESQAMENMIDHFGEGIFSIVMDSYDYAKALSELLPAVVAKKQIGKGGFMVLRPDSGDPVEAVLMALHAADKVFGSVVNKLGYKVINGAGVLQGDGIDIIVMAKIADAVAAAEFSAECVAYGMGGGLLQRLNRDTMSFATKLNHIVYASGEAHDCMKQPQTDTGKFSLPGMVAVKRVDGVPTAFPKGGAGTDEVGPNDNLLRVVYDKGPVAGLMWDNFETVRARVTVEWGALPRTAQVLSASLREKVATKMAEQGKKPPSTPVAANERARGGESQC